MGHRLHSRIVCVFSIFSEVAPSTSLISQLRFCADFSAICSRHPLGSGPAYGRWMPGSSDRSESKIRAACRRSRRTLGQR